MVLASQSLADGGYLFVTFRGEQTPLSEQVYFVVSEDGRDWTALNGGRPVLVSSLGERGVRDPFVLRSADGSKFFLIGTDLSIHHNGNWIRATTAGSKSILVWESDDLVSWSEPRLVQVAPDDAGCAWAPEAIYDEARGEFLVFWASKTGRDGFRKHRIWAARTTDFKSFSEPFIFIERERDIIDTTIVKEGDQYVRFSKDETTKATLMETAGSLDGPWREVKDFSLANLRGYEGPACFVMRSPAGSQPTWCLLLDHYSRGEGYKPFETTDLIGGDFRPAEAFRFPFRLRHGTVMPISKAELDRLRAAFP